MLTRVAVVQFAMSENYEANVAKADFWIEKAAKDGARLVVLPELFTSLYFCQVEDYAYFKTAEVFDASKTLKHFQEVAQKRKVVLPVSFFEKAGNVFFNSLAVIDSGGQVLGNYRKSHIPTGQGYEERFYFAQGDTGFKVFTTAIGRVGVGICWDQWFPETARILALQGAEILLFPTTIGSEPVLPKDSQTHWQNVMRGHAAANLFPVLAANRVGQEKIGASTETFYGSSFIADQHGDMVAALNRVEEGFCSADFDFGALAEERYSWGVFRDRRTDLYGDLLKKDASKKSK